MATGASLVEDALLEAAILGVGETVSAEDQTLGLRILNRMLDSWATENLMIYATTSDSFTMTAGQSTYSTSLLTQRPVSVASMFVSLNSIDYPVTMIDEQTFNAIPYKATSAIPDMCFYNPSFPNGEFKFYPTPYAAFTCTVNSRYPLAGNIAAATALALPQGYEKAIIDNLAVELCRPFTRKSALPELMKSANETKATLKRVNYEPLLMNSVMDQTPDVSNAFIYKGF